MKFDARSIAALVSSTLVAGQLSLVSAQTPQPKSVLTTPEKTYGEQSTGATQTQATREKREQAYAKLLEGQRYLVGGNLTDATLKLAQQAFQQATVLDPSLSEAYNGLADIAFYYRSDFDEAERQAQAAVRANRNSFGAHRILSRILTFKSGLREGNVDKTMAARAIAELREVVRLNSSDAEGWALIGDFQLALENYPEAITAYKNWEAAPTPLDSRVYQIIMQGQELTPENASARLGEAYLRAGRPAEAYQAISRALARNSDNDESFNLLYEAIQSGGVEEATALPAIQQLAAANPENAAAQKLVARIQSRLGRNDEAVKILRAALTRHAGGQQGLPELHEALAEVLSNAMRQTEAVAAYEDVLKDKGVNGDSPLASPQARESVIEVFKEIVRLQKQAGRSSDAVATIERMRRVLGREDPNADLQYVELLRDQGKKTEALQATRDALTKYPEQSDLIWYQALTLADLGRVDEAVTFLRGKIKNSLEDVDKYIYLSTLYTQAGRGAEAVEAARKALNLIPTKNQKAQNNVLMLLSSAQEKAGDNKGAEDSLRRVLEKDPNNHLALNNLGYFLVDRNEKVAEALAMIQRAVRLEPFNPSYLDSLGWAYFKMNRLEDAERYLGDAARRDASSPTIQEHLGDLYQKRGKVDQARLAWQKALSLSVEAAETNRLRAKLNTGRR